ncbi:MAG TPA: four helix bundle protein [Vicinamibacterales bacterium]|nr:four helix bundle protein [Vicinamibacterales bacterium]
MAAPYKNLVAWQRADDLFIEVHRLTHEKFPRHEKFELGGQIRRAAYSVPANIVEGNSRQHPGEAKQFLSIASGSLSEVGYGLHAALRLGYIGPDEFERLDLAVRQTAAPLHGLIKRLREGSPLLSQSG